MLCLGLSVLVVALACGCATPRPRVDPLERVNRVARGLDGVTERVLFGPAAAWLDARMPEPARAGVGGVLQTISMPKLVVSDLLQAKFSAAGEDLGRFFVNLLFGLGGWYDIAERVGLASHGEDMGQVLCRWRIPFGPYVYFPLLGPSSAAEAVSSTLDTALAPFDTFLPYFARKSARARLRRDIATAHEISMADPYLFERVAYQKNRVLAARDVEGFSPVTPEELGGVAYGTCGNRRPPVADAE